ncbi:hypothetical protein FPZ12_033335 [Amycolatopsis acidicola]|uniref:Uncharacterized protein n=1 Tax=Amycolatopsis acidicola TaxID=2596893 RepID=A0A5N0UUN0_9PSEU|nr:hypothetical protein [Amycolatopsis acidicola]KAA9153868.1 hypothetical protein FPZ12_033335 [Amycolatopsis acidicola]
MTSQISTLAGRGLSHAVKLTHWVGSGKPVTAKGVLRPSEVPAAAAVLGVKVPKKVRTAADVTPIHWPWLAAEGAGLIEIGASKAVACPVDEDPAELWLKGLNAVLRAESHDRHRKGAVTLCRAVLSALSEERVGIGNAVDADEVARRGDVGERGDTGNSGSGVRLEVAVREILDGYDDGAAAGKSFRQSGLPVADAVELLRTFGALDRKNRLTPLGEWVYRWFEERAPEAVTPETAVPELLARLATLPEDEAWRQALRWFGDRRPVFGAAQLLYAAEFTTPVERVAAVEVVAGFGDEALTAWRNSLRYNNLRAHALAALADWGEGRGVDGPQRRWLVTEYALSARMRGGVEAAFHYVRDCGGLELLAESEHPAAAELHRELAEANVRVRVQQLKVEPADGDAMRVVVPDAVTLGRLHEILGILFGHRNLRRGNVRHRDLARGDLGRGAVGYRGLGRDGPGGGDVGYRDSGRGDLGRGAIGYRDLGRGGLGGGNVGLGHGDVGHRDLGRGGLERGDGGYRDMGRGNAGLRGSGQRDSGRADAGLRGSGQRDSGRADAGLRGSGQRDSGRADAGLRGSGQRDSGRADAGLRDSGHRGSGRAEVGHRNAGRSDASPRDPAYRNAGLTAFAPPTFAPPTFASPTAAPPAFGYRGDEPHEFVVGGVPYADPFDGLADRGDEHEIRLSTIFPRPGNGLTYICAGEYKITCEKITDPDPGLTYPVCVPGTERLNRRLAALRIPQP